MTITEFHNALLQGRGKCIQAVREDPEKYRDEVLWACRELVSFDTQCEGSKGWFIHEMVHCYPDRTPFVKAWRSWWSDSFRTATRRPGRP